MAKKVFKYKIDTSRIWLPVGAEILHIGFYEGVLNAWAVVDPERTMVPTLYVAGTGHALDVPSMGKFWGTFVFPAPVDHSPTVLHVWEIKSQNGSRAL